MIPFRPAVPELGILPLDVLRLLASDLLAEANGDEFRAAFLLWCQAQAQDPVGTLPANEFQLAALSGADEAWPRVRAMALRHWTLGRDGRLHHPVVTATCAELLARWRARDWQRARTKERVRRHRARRRRPLKTNDSCNA